MANSEVHKRKRKKNLTVLAIIFAWIALIWIITMINIANAQEFEDLPQPEAQINIIAEPQDPKLNEHYRLENFFKSGRAAHFDEIVKNDQTYTGERTDHQKEMIDPMARRWWTRWVAVQNNKYPD